MLTASGVATGGISINGSKNTKYILDIYNTWTTYANTASTLDSYVHMYQYLDTHKLPCD